MAGEASGAPAKRKRLRRIFRWLFFVALFGFLVLVTGVWMAYVYRVSLTNHVLTYVGPYEVSIGSLEIQHNGSVHAANLKVKHRDQSNEWLTVPELTIRPGWWDLASGRIGELKIRKPVFQLDDRLLEEWFSPKAKETLSQVTESVPLQSSSAFPFYLGELNIEDALLRWNSPGMPLVEMTLQYHGEKITRNTDGSLQSGVQKLEIRGETKFTDDPHEPSPIELRSLKMTGAVEKGVVHITDFQVKGFRVHLNPTVSSWLDQWAEKSTRSNTKRDDSAKGSVKSTMITGIKMDRMRWEEFDWKLQGLTQIRDGEGSFHWPDFQSKMQADLAQLNLDWSHEFQWSIGDWSWQAQDFSVSYPQQPGHLRAEQLLVQGQPMRSLQSIGLNKLSLISPDVFWTQEFKKRISGKSRSTSKPQKEDSAICDQQNAKQIVEESNRQEESPKSTPWNVHLVEGLIENGKLAIKDDQLMAFELDTGVMFEAKNLTIGSKGWSSDSAQFLKVEHGELKFPSSAQSEDQTKLPFFELSYGELVLIPNSWNATKLVEKLLLNQPRLRIRDGNTPWEERENNPSTAQATLHETVNPTDDTSQLEEASSASSESEKGIPWWQQVNFKELTLNEGVSDLLVPAPKPVEARGDINITTIIKDGITQHHVKLENVEARLPTLSRLPFPVAKFSSFEGTVRLPELWKERRIDSMKLEGANLEAGDALMGLVEKDETTPAETSADAVSESNNKQEIDDVTPSTSDVIPPWTVGQLDVQQSSVTIVNLVPGLPAVKFNLEFHAADSPLMSDDFTKNIAPQKVELANLIIPSPYEPLRPVAELDSIFVHFTLQGLMNKHIDRVEIISPTLFVGEDLFWYVDYYRQYVNQDTSGKSQEALLVSTEEAVTMKAVNVLMDGETDPSDTAWSIGRLQVHSGKLILAPKGKPLKGFGKPLPFNINTEVVRGTLAAELEIPPDVYTLEQYKLQFEGMHGKVHFNLPLKQKDNNLVETFEVDRIRWKDLQTGKAYLSITYDKAGIYAKFGAEAYEGYVNGEVNIYNDDTYSWDGWIGGKNVQTNELTNKLFPAYFFMQGQVEATLVAQGNMHELFQADGSFKNHTPGKFSITALNDAVKNLPGDWTQLEKQLTQIGLETLRDFEYDEASAKFRLYGREGEGKVLFQGPHGSRNFNINVYDHRWTTDDPSGSRQTPKPLPSSNE